MPTQNGVSNGVNNPNHRGADDFDSISGTSPQMIMLDETATANGRHDSLTTDGRDNLAFEDDHDHAQGNGKTNGATKTNGTNGTNGHQTPKVSSKMTTDGAGGGDNVEMVPLNPAAVNNQHKNHHPHNNKSTNGASKPTSKDGKAQLDMTNNDYFRPVNNKRKLFRGQKLYVTSDQRSNSRRWKWIAFWGGVFTFVAAALLTGILAATGIIMSKTTPTYAPPTSNDSTAMGWNSTMTLSSTEQPIGKDELTTIKVNATIESFTLPTSLPTDGAISTNLTDSTTLEGHPIAVTDHPTVVTTQSTPQPEINTPLVTSNMTSVSFAVVPTVVTTAAIPVEANETGSIVPTVDGRGRSLPVESEVPHVESETLFPPMDPIFTDEENTTITVIPTVPQPTDNSSLEPSLFNDTDLLNSSQLTELPPFDSPVTDRPSEPETFQINVTHPPISSPIEPLDTVPTDPTFINSTIGLWNNTIIDHNIDEMDSSLSNDSLSPNDTDVLEGKAVVINVTEPSLQHEVNVTDQIPHKQETNDSSVHLDGEEVPIHVDISTTISNISDVENATISAPTTEPTNINVSINHANSSVEVKSLDSDVSNDTDNISTVDISSALPTTSVVDESEEPSNETLTIISTVPSEVSNTNDSTVLAENVTGTSSTWSQIGNLTTVGTTLFDQTEINTMANSTTAEQENSTVSASSL